MRTEFELVINVKTAKALGLTWPMGYPAVTGRESLGEEATGVQGC